MKRRRRYFPRLMWADVDSTVDGREAVAVYAAKKDQRANRPDLVPIPVIVLSAAKNEIELRADLDEAIRKLKRRADRRKSA